MRKATPIVSGFQLDETEIAVISYWLRVARYRTVDKTAELLQQDGPLFLPQISLEELKDLLSFHLPVLVVTPDATALSPLLEAGMIACFPLPPPGEPLIFPDFPPRRDLRVHILSPVPAERNRLRQLCALSGLEARSDFRNLPELLAGENPAHLLIIKIDGLRLADLETWLLEQQERPLVLLMRDFSASAPSLQDMYYLRKIARRVFSFTEAFYVLMEALIYHEAESAAFNNLRSLLFAEKIHLLKEPPQYSVNPLAARRGLPFAWLYPLLAREQGVIIQ
ncbi:MAG: hypothetical protein HS115_14970 [Spirochaetales bacterium]|nr:hypothetical protein [Spirochaetales bacterium]